MANPRNNCTFVGRIPNTDKIKYEYHAGNDNKRAYMKGNISVRRAYKAKDEQYYTEDLIPFTAFGATADYMNSYVKKGDTIALSGELRVDRVSDGEGNTRTFYNVVVDSVTKIGGDFTENKQKTETKKATEPEKGFDVDNPFVND